MRSDRIPSILTGIASSILASTLLIDPSCLGAGVFPHLPVALFWGLTGLLSGGLFASRFHMGISRAGRGRKYLLLALLPLLLPHLWYPPVCEALSALSSRLPRIPSISPLLSLYLASSPLALPFIPLGLILPFRRYNTTAPFLLPLSITFFILHKLVPLHLSSSLLPLLHLLPPLLYIFVLLLPPPSQPWPPEAHSPPWRLLETGMGVLLGISVLSEARLASLLLGPSPHTFHVLFFIFTLLLGLATLLRRGVGIRKEENDFSPASILSLVGILLTCPVLGILFNPELSPLFNIPILLPYPLHEKGIYLTSLSILLLPILPFIPALPGLSSGRWIAAGFLLSFPISDLFRPALGLRAPLFAVPCLYILLILARRWKFRPATLLPLLLPPILMIALTLSLPGEVMNRALLGAGFYNISSPVEGRVLRVELRRTEVIEEAQDPFSFSQIKRADGSIELAHWGTIIAKGGEAEENIVFSSLLPVLLHGEPSHILISGGGGGRGVEILSSIPLKRLTLLEPSPARLRLMKSFLGPDVWGGVSPLVSIEARSLMNLARRGGAVYDIILLSNPLFSVNFEAGILYPKNLEVIRGLLKEGGILSMPINLNRISLKGLKYLFKAFSSLFPSPFLFSSPSGSEEVNLVGFKGGGEISLKRIARAMEQPGVRQALNKGGVENPEDIFEFFLTDRTGLESFLHGEDLPHGFLPFYREFHRYPYRDTDPFKLRLFLPHIRDPLKCIRDLPEDPLEREALFRKFTIFQEGRRLYFDLLASAEEGDFKRLHQEAKRFLHMRPDRGEGFDTLTGPFLERGERLFHSGHLDQAILQFALVLMINPEDRDALEYMGDIHFRKGFYKKARNYYRRCVEIEGKPERWHKLASAFRMDGVVDKALEAELKAVDLDPYSSIYRSNVGSLFLEKGENEKALEYFRAATILDGLNADALAGISEVHLRRGELNLAMSHILNALKIEEKIYFHYILGKIYFEQKNLARAKGEFIKVILADPDFLEARGALGLVFALEGNFKKAESEWKEVLRIDPENRAAKENLKRMEEHRRIE